MNKQAMIEVLTAKANEFHPEHGIRRGIEMAVAFMDAFLDVEQTLYYIKFSETQYVQWFDEDEGDLMLVNSEAFAGVFTEEEINKTNPNLMALAVEVAE